MNSTIRPTKISTRYINTSSIKPASRDRCQRVKTRASVIYSRFTIYNKFDTMIMTRFAKPVFLGLLAFAAWVGLTYIITAGVLNGASNEAHENAGSMLAILLFVGSLFFAGAVAAWFAPTIWCESSAIVGFICTTVLAWFSSFSGDVWFSALALFFGVSMSFAGAATVRYFLKWLKD